MPLPLRFTLSLLIVASASPLEAHPGALSEYPERFPGKTLQTIVAEWEPAKDEGMSEANLFGAVAELANDWTMQSAADLKLRVTALLDENRRGDYRKRFANVLNDMLDLLSQGEAARTQEVAEFLHWRVDHSHADDGFFDEMERGRWDEPKEKAGERTLAWQAERDAAVAEVRTRADAAADFLRPNWLIQAGAIEFRHRRHQQATELFQQVCDAFPNHPRTEVATLMLALVKIDEWKQSRWYAWQDNAKARDLLAETWRAFEAYQTRYPNGRFGLDVIGWKAGIARLREYFGEALDGFLSQAAQRDHPEIRRRAFQQIEWLLNDLAEKPELEMLPWDKIAAEPVVALRLGYFMLDAESETDLGALMFRRSGGDHRVLESLAPTLTAVRTASLRAWSRLDRALAENTTAYQGERAVIREVLHAWSAIMRGQPALGLHLVDAARPGPGRDDALLARAVAKLKVGQFAAGIRALDYLEQQCPDSPLCRGVLLRRADAWLELNRADIALPLLWDMLEGKDEARYHLNSELRPALHLPGESEQRLSAILTFGPIAQLESLLRSKDLPDEFLAMLHGTLRVRHLSEGRFEESLRHAEDADFEHWVPAHHDWEDSAEKLAQNWRENVNALQQRTQEVQGAVDAANKAAALLKQGNEWERYLWRLLDGGHVYVGNPSSTAQLPPPSHQLRQHAQVTHVEDNTAATMLDQRQEMTHAIRCYEEALNLSPQGSDSALEALQALHTALRTRAEFSPYFMDRAVERDDAAWSKKLHDRLLADHPGSEAAKSAVWWTFRPESTLGEWRPGGYAMFRVEVDLAARLGKGDTSTNYWEDDWRSREALKKLTDQLRHAFEDTDDRVALRRALTEIRAAVLRDAPGVKATPLLNHLDDLDALLGVSDVSDTALAAYFDARMKGKPMDLENPYFSPIRDFVSFWNGVITPSSTPMNELEKELAVKQPERSVRQRVARAQVIRMTVFLKEFPTSPKREAALARLAINTLRQSRCHAGMNWIDAVAEASTAYAGFKIERGIAFDQQAVVQALGNYARDFPHGRYAWDLRLVRAIADSEAHEWRPALEGFVEVLNNPSKRDLHLDASNNLGELFMQLLEPIQRTGIVSAIKSTPGAWDKLDAFIHSPTCGWRLRVLEGWLEAQK